MNKQELINRVKKQLNRDSVYGNKLNAIRIHPTESFEHFLAKCIKCWELYQQEKPFWSEVFTKGTNRCKFDILSPVENKTIEISHSDEDIDHSKENYPENLEIEEIKAKEFIDAKLKEYKVV